MTTLQDQQEVMADLAAIIMQVYALESALLRARKLAGIGHSSAEAAEAMTGLLADEAMGVAEQAARRVLAACAEAICCAPNWLSCAAWPGSPPPMR